MGAIDVGIGGLGSYVPDRVLTNADIERMVETSDEWIRDRTGIVERRVVPPGVNTAHMACSAGRSAVAASALTGRELAFVIVSTGTPDLGCPSVAARVGRAVELGDAPCFDLNAACSGFVYGLTIGMTLLRARGGGHGLLVASEQVSAVIDYRDRTSCMLFGDGAAAAVLTSIPPHHRILHAELGSDPRGTEAMSMGGHAAYGTEAQRLFRQDGRKVFRFGVGVLQALIRKGLDVARISDGDRFHVVPHQANLRMIQHVALKMRIPEERFFVNIQTRGNTSSASIAIALAEAAAQGRFAPGDKVLLVAFGGGLTWALAVVEW
jgi:3-oxoacyl-[acyl-carrier-protein] synthase-3